MLAGTTRESVYQPEQEGLLFPRVPVFATVDQERCCQQQLMVEATGRPPVPIPPERARYSREHVGSDYIGWLHFQPIYDRLVETSPDMFE